LNVHGPELDEAPKYLITGLNKNYRTGVDPNDRN
jgi:hypothetical protein